MRYYTIDRLRLLLIVVVGVVRTCMGLCLCLRLLSTTKLLASQCRPFYLQLFSPIALPVTWCCPVACKPYVTTLVDYISKLSDGWRGHALTPAYGATIATGVIEMLLGKEYSPKSMGVEPMWLKLYRGIVIASRALDLWAAPPQHPCGRHSGYRNARTCALCLSPAVRTQGIIESSRAYSVRWALIRRVVRIDSIINRACFRVSSFERVLKHEVCTMYSAKGRSVSVHVLLILILWIAPAPGVRDHR